MAQQAKAMVYKSVLSWRGCEKLYLDSRTADVYFVFNFDGEEYKKVPAHKSLLSAISPVFDAMFYGEAKEQSNNIEIVDSSAEAFEEFLQFFYRSTVQLTAENAFEVLNLGHKYEIAIDHCLDTTLIDLCESMLTTDNMCWGYEIAIIFERQRLKQFCEQKINENPMEILHSNSFLTCKPNLLRHILRMDSLKRDKIVFDGCLAWSRAACVRDGLDDNWQNIRTQLGDLFYDIGFDRMTIEIFIECYRTNEQLFSLEDYREISMMILCKDFQPAQFRRNFQTLTNNACNGNALICDRKEEYNNPQRNLMNSYSMVRTLFYTNCKTLLQRIYFGKLINEGNPLTQIKMRIFELEIIRQEIRDTIYKDVAMVCFAEAPYTDDEETIVNLEKALVVKPYIRYRIELKGISAKPYPKRLRKFVEMDYGIDVMFEHDFGTDILTRLDFVLLN